MQRTILKAQLEQEQIARSVAGGSVVRVVLSDRSAIDPVAYAFLTAANEEDARERMRVLVDTPEFQTALHWYREGTFILFKPVPEWLVDDGVRTMDEQAQNIEVFRNILKELGIPYTELGEEMKDLQARVAFAKGLIGTNGWLLETESKCSYHRPYNRGETLMTMRLLVRNRSLSMAWLRSLWTGRSCRRRPQQIHAGIKSTNSSKIQISDFMSNRGRR